MAGRLYITDQGFSFSAKAVETISGGQIVRAVSGATVLTTNNQMSNVLEVALVDAAGDHTTAVGVAINTGVSGDRIGVATAGIHGFYASNGVTAGNLVFADGSVASADAALAILNVNAGSQTAYHFGRALSTAASGQLTAVQLR